MHKSGWMSADHNTTCFIFLHCCLTNLFLLRWCSTLFWSAGDPCSFRRCVSKSSLQKSNWSQSLAVNPSHSFRIFLSKIHQKVFVETDHTDHNIQSFDAAEDCEQTPCGCPPDHSTICLFYLINSWQARAGAPAGPSAFQRALFFLGNCGPATNNNYRGC